MTRIVAGRAKGRTLSVPAKGTRPTSDRVREALFSRLEHWDVIDGATVIDLYAGSGALGFEALSRGATCATLVDFSRGAAKTMRDNVKLTGLPATVIQADVKTYLGSRVGEALSGSADLVFIDPPYDIAESEMTAVLAGLGAWIHADSLIVIERSKRQPQPRLPEFLQLEDTSLWGETVCYFAGPPLANKAGAQTSIGADTTAVEGATE